MTLIQTGTCRLQVLDAQGVLVKTLVLPAPAKGEPTLKWEPKESTVELLDGSERTRRLGWLPSLTLSWRIYPADIVNPGTADGQTPTAEQLLDFLGSMPPGRLRVRGGKAAGWLTGGKVATEAINPVGGTLVQGLRVTFRGRTVRSSMTLEA